MSEIDKYYLQPNQATPIDGLTEIAPGGVSDTPLQPTAGETTQTGDSTSFPTNKLTSQNYVPSQSGWALKENGDVEFGSGKFRGDITGASGTFSGTITASAGTIGGFSISATALTASNFSLDSSGQRLTLGSGNDIVIADADDATYRLWAGNATAASAPFSVGKDGALTASNATITGDITATTGSIGGFDIGSDYIRDAADSFGLASTVTGSNDVRFWAGTTFANRANAPFRTFEDGSTVTSNLTVTGGSISIGGQAVVNTDGSSEFLNTLIGRQQVTVDNTANLNTVLSDLSSAGGGILYLKAGTYTLSSALTYYSNITIRGISQNATILDFNNTGVGIVAAGSSVYTTGTLTSITGGVNVTGFGTSWLANVTPGQQLFLNNRWHVIAAVNSDTSITLAESYGGPTVTAGTSYRIASPMVNIALEQLTVKNATGDGFNIDDVREVELSNLLFLDCNVGFTMTNTSEITTNIVTTASCTSDGYQLTNVGFGGLTTLSSAGNGGNGATINDMNTIFVSTSSCAANTGDGYNLTDVSNSAFIVEASANGGQGIELVSGCDNNFIYAGLIENNTSDGIKLTATCDNNTIGSSCNVLNNGGYGVNIAASTCDDNLIIGVHFEGNTSGSINDSGTGTVVQACLPLSVNDAPADTVSLTADEDLSAGDVVYPTGNNLIKRVRPTSVGTVDTTVTEPAAVSANYKILPIDATRQLHIRGGDINGNKAMGARIGTINANEDDFTYGTEYTFGGVNSDCYDVCQIDSTRFLVTYHQQTATTASKAVLLDVGSSGTTITNGTPVTIGTRIDTSHIPCVGLDSSRALIGYYVSSGNAFHVQVLSLSGTTITTNTGVDMSSTQGSQTRASFLLLETDKVLVVYGGDNSDPLRAKTIDISGTTPTVNGANTLDATNRAYTMGLSEIDSSKAMLVYSYSDGASDRKTQAAVLSISGSTVTKGSNLELSTISQADDYINVVSVSPTVFITATDNGSSVLKYHLLQRDGTTVSSIATNTGTFSSTNSSTWICRVKPFLYLGVLGTNYGLTTLGSTSNIFIGVATEDIADSASGAVALKGYRNETFSVLTAGTIYYIDDSGTATTESSSVSQRLGVAINTTTIPIES